LYVERLYAPAFEDMSNLRKALNRHGFLLPGTLLAAIRGESVRIGQPRLGASMKSILDDSFRYTKSIDTDIRKTFARIRREQRQQARAQVDGENPRKVFPLSDARKHAAAS
jgi:hypothetical protein